MDLKPKLIEALKTYDDTAQAQQGKIPMDIWMKAMKNMDKVRKCTREDIYENFRIKLKGFLDSNDEFETGECVLTDEEEE